MSAAKKVVSMNDEGLFGGKKTEKEDVAMKSNGNDKSEKKNDGNEEKEKTSADYYFDSYSHFGMELCHSFTNLIMLQNP